MSFALIIAYRVESLCEVFCPASMRQIPINRMISEKLFLFRPGILHWQVVGYILLTSVDHTDKTEFEGISSASQYLKSVCTRIHQVEFGEDAKSAKSTRVDRTSEFEGVRVGKVDIGG